MRFVRKLFIVALAAGLVGCQTAGPAAKSQAERTATQSSTARSAGQAGKTNVMLGVGY